MSSVALVAYFHGKPGRDKWTRAEKIGIPMNLFITVALLVFIFSGKELGAASESVVVQDEDGNQIERMIPKSAFRKRVAIFNFDNRTGKPALDWLQYGIPLGIDFDLIQDTFMQTANSARTVLMYNKIKEAGFPGGVGLPLTLMRKLAADYHMKYFLKADLTKVDDAFTLNTFLYETKLSKLIAEHTVTGVDIFKLMDAISV